MSVAAGFRGMMERFRLRSEGKPPERRLAGEARLSLLIHFFFQFGASMSGLFLNLYLWRLTGDLWINGMYNIINFTVSAGGFVLGGWIAKKTDRMYAYRLGLLLISAFYICVVLAQEKVAEFYQLFAIFGGLSGSFYWVGYLVLMYDVSNDRNRIHYLAMNSIIFTFAGLIGPALAGRVIAVNDGLHGYIIVFGIAFLMFLLAALGSLKIKAKPSSHKTYYLKHTYKIMRRQPGWLKALWAFFSLGLLQGIMLFLPNILLYQVMPYEDQIGYMSVLFSIITILMGMMISKYAKEEMTTPYLWISGVGMIVAASLLISGLQVWSVITFMVVYSFFNPLQGNTLSSHYYRLVGKLPLKGNFRVESVVVRECFLNSGRVISIAALIFLLSEVEGKQLAYILLGGAACQLLLPLLIRVPGKGSAQEKKSLQA
jgi:MFS transporter, YQGE family, putative transporter